MVCERDLLEINTVAKLCGTTASSILNWKSYDPNFPAPYQASPEGPVWKEDDIITYLHKKLGPVSTENLMSKRMAVVGRARGGKSFLNSKFVMDRAGFVQLFCGNSNDKTACPIYVKITDCVPFEEYIFHSDFNRVYKDKKAELGELPQKISDLVDRPHLQQNIHKMREIEDVIKEINSVEAQHPNRKNSTTYIDTFQRPSDFCREILRKCNLGRLEIVDTPGVSGNVNASQIAKSDIYLFLVKPDNADEAQTLKKIVTAVKADVAASKAVFLYKKEGIFLTKKKYEDARASVRRDMAVYDALFEDLKGNIISTELDVLNPADHCILFPTMDKEDVLLPEELFLEEIGSKMINAFRPGDKHRKDKEFGQIIQKYGEEATTLVTDLLSNIPKHDLFKEILYSTDQIIAEKHDRVKTQDQYRLRTDLDMAYHRESKCLDDYFSSFTVTDYPMEWQQILVKYVYKKLTGSIRSDRGLGVGKHPLEEHPARTMLTAESILADRVLNKIVGKLPAHRAEPYKEALQLGNLSSATWNYVDCEDSEDAITKLEIIKECLLNVKVSSRQDMVLCRHVGGLRKIAEYAILADMGYSKTDCMKMLQTLPF